MRISTIITKALGSLMFLGMFIIAIFMLLNAIGQSTVNVQQYGVSIFFVVAGFLSVMHMWWWPRRKSTTL
ncbi:MAG: hypothetical protein ABSB40_09605 [Nitrososphaeria archaeon]